MFCGTGWRRKPVTNQPHESSSSSRQRGEYREEFVWRVRGVATSFKYRKNKEQRTSAISSLLIWWAGQGGATTTVQYNIANSKTSTYRFVLFISPFGLREPIFRLLFWRKIFVVAEKAYFVHYVYRAYTYVNVSLSAA
jgi:hypothetical protein